RVTEARWKLVGREAVDGGQPSPGDIVLRAGAGADAERPEGTPGRQRWPLTNIHTLQREGARVMPRNLGRAFNFLGLLIALCTLAQAQPTTKPGSNVPTKAEARGAIDEFLKSPQMGPQAKLIMEYAEKSDDVLISVFPELFSTWAGPSSKYSQAPVLLTTF